MGKNTATSWLSMVKKAFRSPAKEKSCRRREECGQEEEEKKREKRRWLFRRPSNINHVQQCEAKTPTDNEALDIVDQRHAIAVAEATTAAAEAAVATAQAAVEIVQLSSRASNYVNIREHYIYAAIIIQTSFRGYLARRALRALKGLVKLQALVRGHNVRRQTKVALKCMQSLVRVQDRVLDEQRARLSHEGYYSTRKSMFDETNALWESRYLQDIRRRRSMSRDMSCTTEEWDDRPQTSEDIEALFQNKKQAASKREKALADAFSNQIWRSRRNQHSTEEDEKEIEERTKWLDRWMSTKQWEINNNNNNRASTDKRDSIKTVEIDTTYKLHQIKKLHSNFSLNQYPPTPSPCKIKPLQVRSASPRCYYSSAANTPSLASTYCTTNGTSRYGNGPASSVVPNYMTATESAKAKARSMSTPRQRPSTPERERGGVSLAKKRLSYPAPEIGIGSSSFSQNLRSPSFKSAYEGHYGMDKDSIYSSYYTESFGGEISPCSTTDLRWLK